MGADAGGFRAAGSLLDLASSNDEGNYRVSGKLAARAATDASRSTSEARPTVSRKNLKKEPGTGDIVLCRQFLALFFTSIFRGFPRITLCVYTQTTSKIGNMPRRRPGFEPSGAGAEAAQLE